MKYHIFHHNDMDGHASGAITAYGLGLGSVDRNDILFYRINYGQPFDDSKIDYEKDKVYVVDFALQPYERMAELNKKLKSRLTWIDHHKTSAEWLEENRSSMGKWSGTVVNGKRAACEMCWEYFIGASIPRIIKMISQYDIWNKEYPDFDWDTEQLPLQMYFRSIDTRPEEHMAWWDHQISLGINYPESARDELKEMIDEGETLKYFDEKRMKSVTLSAGYNAEFCGHKAFVINTTQAGSRQFEVAVEMSEYDLVISYHLHKGEYWVVNLYSIKPDMDCGALAKRLGAEGPCGTGGGHAGAAGFQTSTEHLFGLIKKVT